MSDETTTKTNEAEGSTESTRGTDVQQDTQGTDEIPASAVRAHPLFKKLSKQLKEREERLGILSQAEAEREQALERAKAEEQGRLKDLLDVKEREHRETIARYESRIAEHELRVAAMAKGITDELALDGLVHRFASRVADDGEELPGPTAWLEGLASDERTKSLFERKPVAVGTGPSASPATRATRGTHEEFMARLRNFADVEAQQRADEYVRQGVPMEEWR